jgi:hypothetical protein
MLLGLLLAAVPNADAQAKPFMWGVGPSVNTYLFPFGYPHSFPETDVAADNPQSNMEKADLVMGFGGKAVMYMDRKWRGGIRPMITRGFGDSNYSSFSISAEVDHTIQAANGINILAGAGIGTGGFTFDQGKNTGGVLTARQLFARGQAGVMFKNPTRSYELMLFAILSLSGEEQYERGDNTYTKGGSLLPWVESEASESLSGGWYTPVVGIEGTLYFGDFKPPKNKRNKRKKGKKNKKGNKK